MAQRITNVCDECLLADGADSPALSWAVTITPPGEKATPYEIDVCERHGKPLADLAAHLADYARRADRRRPSPAPSATDAPVPGGFACSLCSHVGKTRGGMVTHAREKHGRTLAELDGTASITCPVRGCKRMFTKPQGLSRHLAAPVHHWDADRAKAAIASLKSGK